MQIRAHSVRTLAILFVVSLAAPAVATAQIGVKGGLNLANVAVTPNPGITFDKRIGPLGGVFFGATSDKQVDLVVDLLYTQKGAKLHGTGQELRLDYAELPLMIKIRLANSGSIRVHALVGYAFDYLLTARGITTGLPTIGLTSSFVRYDGGIVFGGSVTISSAVIDVRYDLGIINIAKNSPTQTTKTRTLSFTVGFGT